MSCVYSQGTVFVSGDFFVSCVTVAYLDLLLAWQCVLRDIRSTQNSERSDRGPQEYVEKNPNPNLHCKGFRRLSSLAPTLARVLHNNGFSLCLSAFTPVDLSDLKKRNTQDAKKS